MLRTSYNTTQGPGHLVLLLDSSFMQIALTPTCWAGTLSIPCRSTFLNSTHHRSTYFRNNLVIISLSKPTYALKIKCNMQNIIQPCNSREKIQNKGHCECVKVSRTIARLILMDISI